MPTIRDVARQAEVSVATVSRVLNESGYVDAGTRRRVLEAVGQLGYRRNVHWSRLAAQSSRTILFLLGNRETLNSMQMRVLVACQNALDAQGFDLVFTRFRYLSKTKPNELALPRMLEQPGAVDGVILAGLHADNLLDALDTRKLPYVFLANNYAGSTDALTNNCVLYDDESAVMDATRYLLRLGHRRIGYLGNTELAWFARRFHGFQRAMRENGNDYEAVRDDWAISNIDYGQMGAAQLLRSPLPPSAIVAANDEIAAGAWKELVRRGIAIPGDMSLIGFGDREEFSILEPSLTTVKVFDEQLGERLGRMILQRLATSEPVPTERYPCKLIERQSCAPFREPLPIRRPKRLS